MIMFESTRSTRVVQNTFSSSSPDWHQERRDVRIDISRAGSDGTHLVLSFASSRKAKVQCGDTQSAYFAGRHCAERHRCHRRLQMGVGRRTATEATVRCQATDCMLSDALTKQMTPTKLVEPSTWTLDQKQEKKEQASTTPVGQRDTCGSDGQ